MRFSCIPKDREGIRMHVHAAVLLIESKVKDVEAVACITFPQPEKTGAIKEQATKKNSGRVKVYFPVGKTHNQSNESNRLNLSL
jgi:hypothetical protein